MGIFKILFLSLAAVFSENLIFAKYLGFEPFLTETKNTKTAVLSGLSITLLTAVTCFVTSLVDILLLKRFSIEYMRTFVFVLIMVALWKVLVSCRRRFKFQLSYVLSSTAILGTALIVSSNGFNPFEALVYGIFAGLGYMLSSFIFAEIRARLKYSNVPKFFEGVPILLITAGLIALAFVGFHGMKFM